MAGVGDFVRRLDYQKRARNTLGLRKSGSTKIQECSTFVRSANERHLDVLKGAMRKMEADEKQFRGVHDKQMSHVKRFHNTVHVKSADLSEVNLSSNSPSDVAKSSSSLFKDTSSDAISRRRSSVPIAVTSSSHNEAKRRHSVQPDSSKYGRSFRMLKDAFIPKRKISPEPKPKGNLTLVGKYENTSTVLPSGASSVKKS